MRSQRIISEIRNFKRDKTIKNAYIHFNETNINNIDVLIVGNNDTPYECGYFWFVFTYPVDYPTCPINVVFKTTNNGTIRFNPNLYANGKVCLSLINTWGHDDWSPANNLSSVIISIQSLVLHDCPINNEPSLETLSQKSIKEYNSIIRYH
jgi:ubiquitin-conjugating enzyme E2 Z